MIAVLVAKSCRRDSWVRSGSGDGSAVWVVDVLDGGCVGRVASAADRGAMANASGGEAAIDVQQL